MENENKRKAKNKYVKYTVNVVNLLIGLNGLVLVATGLFILFYYIKDTYNTYYYIFSIGVVLVSLGGLLLILSIVGSVSVMNKYYIFIGGYYFTLIVLLVVVISGAIVFFVFDRYNYLENDLHSNLNRSFISYGHIEENKHDEESDQVELNNDQLNTDTNLVDQIQQKFHCCGFESYLEWKNSSHVNSNKKFEYLNNRFLLSEQHIPFYVPDSCCVVYESECGKDLNTINTIFTRGCFKQLNDSLKKFIFNIHVIACGTFIILVLSIFYLLFASLLVRSDYNLITMEETYSKTHSVIANKK